MGELMLSAEALVVQSCKQSEPLVLDMRKVYKAESRMCELISVTREKAGELLFTFIEAWREAREHLARITAEYGRSKQRLKSIKSLVLLDRASEVLKNKDQKSSADTRAAVVDIDPDYLAMFEIMQQLEAARQEMEDKAEALKMAYFSVHKLIEPAQPKKNFSGGDAEDDPTEYTPSEKVQRFVEDHTKSKVKGFGRAKL